MTDDQEWKVEFCIENAELMNGWECDFVDGLHHWRGATLSVPQEAKLNEIVASLRRQGAEDE